MVNSTIVSIFKGYKSFWDGYTNDSDFMSIKISNDAKNDVRQNFNISYNEEILFIRDTSFWNSRNQGLVITDNGIYCIPDNDKPDEKIVFTWDIVSKVRLKDDILFFYGYNGEEDYLPIHVCYFCKQEGQFGKIGNKCVEIFNRLAASIQPEASIYDQVWELLDQGKTDVALDLALQHKNENGNENLYYPIAVIYHSKGNHDKEIEYCSEGWNAISLLPDAERRNLITHLGLLAYLKYSAIINSGKLFENLKECRINCLHAANLTPEDVKIKDTIVVEDARGDFNTLNEKYAEDFLSLPYNERKLLCPVKEYTTLKEYVSVLDTVNLEKAGVEFQIGHPIPNQLYVGHPYLPAKYIPFDNYELVLIEDKVREFCQIAQALGATEIDIECLNSISKSNTFAGKQQANGSVDYKVSTGTGRFNRDRNEQFLNDINQSLTLHQRFSPVNEPYLPMNLVWYHNEPSWQRLYEQRMHGGLDEHEERMETKKNQVVETSELKSIAAEMKSLVIGANGNWEQSMEEKYEGHENAILAIHIKFAPLSSLKELGGEYSDNEESSTELSMEEREYMDELKACLEGGEEITSRERRLLSRLCEQLGLSEERAAELEKSLVKPQLTDDEKEYLAEYKECLVGGEISEKERRLLDKFRNMLGISEQRAEELEKMW